MKVWDVITGCLRVLRLHLLVPNVNCTHLTSIHQFAKLIMDRIILTMRKHAVIVCNLANLEK